MPAVPDTMTDFLETCRMIVNLDDVQHAAERTRDHLVRTPCLHSATLSKLTGCELYIKFENHQFTAAFKERGA